ncbi:hypothetical protein HRI_002386100 [Hibiscus trionum]|uniref:Endonuclease/exonuclease/phosphatase domain-containing protein n=1 Tax=Hibiscus trionum TaxID=183268 RepID=A0A9W7M453_HIBTR|nr:hypothetical protein HRI_002386100 [Hibiscus trionum]
MALLAWNVRGLDNRNIVQALNGVIFKYNSCIVFLSETKQRKSYLEKLPRKNKFSKGFYVNPIRKAEGLALWLTEVDITILNERKNLIDVSISSVGSETWLCSFIYAPPYNEEKQKL